jgi:hypothetical protein
MKFPPRERGAASSTFAGLACEGEGFKGPALGQVGSSDAPLHCAFLPRVPLRPDQTRYKLGVRDLFPLGSAQLFLTWEVGLGRVPCEGESIMSLKALV